jgi:hypothetical protein
VDIIDISFGRLIQDRIAHNILCVFLQTGIECSLTANFILEMANNVLYLAINAQVRDSCHRLIGSPIEEAPASTHFGAWRPHPRDAIRDDDPTT